MSTQLDENPNFLISGLSQRSLNFTNNHENSLPGICLSDFLALVF